MRYNQEATVGERINSDTSHTPNYLPGENRAKRQRQLLRDYLLRKFSLNQLIASARKAGTPLKFYQGP